jgi:hypothetical protein
MMQKRGYFGGARAQDFVGGRSALAFSAEAPANVCSHKLLQTDASTGRAGAPGAAL